MAEAAFESMSFPLSHAEQIRMQRRGLGKSHGGLFKRIWGIAALFMIIVWVPNLLFPEQQIALYERLARTFGVSCDTVAGAVSLFIFVTFLAVLLAIVRQMRTSQSRRVGDKVDWTMTAEESGLRYASRNLEYLLHWPGFHQVFAEPEGLILVHGNSYLFIPNEAFPTPEDRRAFVQLLAARVPADALARSGAALAI